MTSRVMGFGVLAVVVAAGCGESCPTESPEVQAVSSCTAPPGASVPVGVQLCPTCNQVLAGCSGEPISQNTILLDPIVEACDSEICNDAPACDLGSTCTITAPTEPGTYTISVVQDPTAQEPVFIDGTLTVVAASGPATCDF